MANSTDIFSTRVAESTAGGGDISTTTFLPTFPAENDASWIAFATTTATVDSVQGEELFHEENHGRRSPGEDPLKAIGLVNTTGSTQLGAADGEFIRVMYSDAITLAHRFTTAAGANPLNYGWGTILGSSMAMHTPGAATVATSADGAAGADAGTSIKVATANVGNFAVGAPIRIRQSGGTVPEYAIITEIGADSVGDGTGDSELKCHPRFSRQIAAGETVELLYAFYPVISGGAANAATHLTAKRDLFLAFDMGGPDTTASVRRVAAICRCSGFSLTNDNRAVGLSMTLASAAILTDDANASAVVTSESPGKTLQHRFGAEMALGANHTGNTGAATGARSLLSNFDWECNVEFDVAPSTPDTRGVLRMQSMDVNNARATITLTTESNETLQRMISRDERRTICVGMGPNSSGEGGAFIITNAGRADGAANLSAGENSLINQQTTLRALAESPICNLTTGQAGAALSDAQKRLATAPFLLCFPRSA